MGPLQRLNRSWIYAIRFMILFGEMGRRGGFDGCFPRASLRTPNRDQSTPHSRPCLTVSVHPCHHVRVLFENVFEFVSASRWKRFDDSKGGSKDLTLFSSSMRSSSSSIAFYRLLQFLGACTQAQTHPPFLAGVLPLFRVANPLILCRHFAILYSRIQNPKAVFFRNLRLWT